jgi:PilZ domain
VTLVNLSRGGALVESSQRLRWGTRCDVEWTSVDGLVSVTARVVRCFVARLEASAVRYRTALSFVTPVATPAEQDLLAEYQVPRSLPTACGDGVVSSHQASRARLSDAARARSSHGERT